MAAELLSLATAARAAGARAADGAVCSQCIILPGTRRPDGSGERGHRLMRALAAPWLPMIICCWKLGSPSIVLTSPRRLHFSDLSRCSMPVCFIGMQRASSHSGPAPAAAGELLEFNTWMLRSAAYGTGQVRQTGHEQRGRTHRFLHVCKIFSFRLGEQLADTAGFL